MSSGFRRHTVLEELPRPAAYALLAVVPFVFGLAWIYILPGRPLLAPNRLPVLYVLAVGGLSGLLELRARPQAAVSGRLGVLFRNFVRVSFWAILALMSGTLASWLLLILRAHPHAPASAASV